MSNPHWNKQVTNSRNASTKKIGRYGRGQKDAPSAVEAGAITTKGIAPTSKGKESGGKSFSISKGTISGTAQGMGAAKKGGKYTWVGPNDSKW